MIEDAIRYHREWGFSIIPIKHGTKLPAISWKSYQSRRASVATLKKWLSNEPRGIAVVLGSVSHNTVVRDFDSQDLFNKWKDVHPQLVERLPIVQSKKGFHVYGRIEGQIHTKFVQSGEIRGEGAYVLLPPSLHPDGAEYRWVNRPKEIPSISLGDFGLGEEQLAFDDLCGSDTNRNDNQARLDVTSHPIQIADGSLSSHIEWAIQSTLPTGPGQRHRLLFELARRLKAIEPDADLVLRNQVFDRWWSMARSIVRTKAREESEFDWLRGFKNAKVPYEDILHLTLEKARKAEPPVWTLDYGQETKLLAAWCRELQRHQGSESTFFLSARSVEKWIKISKSQANRFLRLFVLLEKLQLVKAGSVESMEASTYRYIASDL